MDDAGNKQNLELCGFIIPDGSRVAAAYTGGYIYLSTDSGVTWTRRENARNWTSVASSSDGTVLVGVVDNGQIYVSTDSGANWTPRGMDSGWHVVVSTADGTKAYGDGI